VKEEIIEENDLLIRLRKWQFPLIVEGIDGRSFDGCCMEKK
jgi:hypothetical protein